MNEKLKCSARNLIKMQISGEISKFPVTQLAANTVILEISEISERRSTSTGESNPILPSQCNHFFLD